jgi:sialate O-acetylesterase
LSEGSQTIQIKNTTTIENTFMSVGAVYLRPAALGDMTRPEIRAALAQYKTHQIPKELRLPGVFSDHMVLQRRMAAPVWGRAAAGVPISVRFHGQTKETRATDNGRWKVVLDPMEAGGRLKWKSVTALKQNIFQMFSWEKFGSAQDSPNMEVSVKFPGLAKPEAPYECDNDTKTFLEAGCDPLIRISAVTRDHNKTPHWTALTQENCLDVPALMSSVAVLLRKKLNVPVGVVVRCESSSSSGIWLSRDAVEGDAEIQRQLGEYAKNVYPQLVAEYPEKLKDWELAQEKAKADGSRPPARQNPPPLPGGFVVGASSDGRFEHYGINYSNRIEPVIPFAVRGVVWDQGKAGRGLQGLTRLP